MNEKENQLNFNEGYQNPNRNYPNPNFNYQANLPNATASLVLGIISIIGALCYGVIGIICGIIGLVLANKDIKTYSDNPGIYSAASLSTTNAGRVCCIIGLVIGAVFVTFIIVYLAIVGSFLWQNVKH